MPLSLSPKRKIRVWTVAISAAFSLYALGICVAEPFKGFAATSSSSSIVLLDIGAAIANTCTSSINIGPLTNTSTGDSSTTDEYDANDAVTCTVYTNNSSGYTFGWLVQTGTGTLGARTGTGYMNGFRYVGSGHNIAPLTPAFANTPEIFSIATVGVADSRWAGRLSSTSDTATGAGLDWGSDNAGVSIDKFLNVATGSTVNIAKRNSATPSGGDDEVIMFRAIVGANKIQPSDTYKVTVTFTATTNP